MKEVKIKFYDTSVKAYLCKDCNVKFTGMKCPKCGDDKRTELIKPQLLDDIIIVGHKEWDVISYDGEFLPAWVDWWGKLDLSDLK